MLERASGEVLIAQRPAGRLAAGKWEFPGGKIEAGESAYQALLRELDEELGVHVRSAQPLLLLRQDYSDRRVWLDTWRIREFDNQPQPREGQRLAWTLPAAIGAFDVLPSCWRVAAALQLPRDYVFTPPRAKAETLVQNLSALPHGCLLRLRLPELDDTAYAAFAVRLIAAARVHAIGIILDREPGQVPDLGAAGWHASASRVRAIADRPLPQRFRFLASAHDSIEIASAHASGADAVVLGPVQPTSTHPGAVAQGWPAFGALSQQAGLPVYALGGVGPRDHAIALAHGGFGIAGISAYWGG